MKTLIIFSIKPTILTSGLINILRKHYSSSIADLVKLLIILLYIQKMRVLFKNVIKHIFVTRKTNEIRRNSQKIALYAFFLLRLFIYGFIQKIKEHLSDVRLIVLAST